METVFFLQKQRDFIKVFIGALAMFKKSLIVMSLWFLINHLATDEEKSSYLQYKAETKQNYAGVHSVLCLCQLHRNKGNTGESNTWNDRNKCRFGKFSLNHSKSF